MPLFSHHCFPASRPCNWCPATRLPQPLVDFPPDPEPDSRLHPYGPPFVVPQTVVARVEVTKELVLVGHSPGTKHSTDLVRGSVGAYSKTALALPLLVKSFEFWPAILLEFIPKAVEPLLIKTAASLTLKKFANTKMFSQTGEQRILGAVRRGSDVLSKNPFGLGKDLRIDGDVNHLDRGQARKHCAIVLEVGCKPAGFGSCSVYVAERNQRSEIGGRTRDEYGKSVHEIPSARRALRVPRTVVAGKQAISLETQSGTEEVELFVLRCQIPVLGMGEHEIEAHEFCFDGRGLTPALIRVVFVVQHFIDAAGTEVVDQRSIRRAVDPDVTFRAASFDQTLGASTGFLAKKFVVLTAQEVAAMKGDRAKKGRLAMRITAVLQGEDPLFIGHRERMAWVSPGPSGTGLPPCVRRALSRAAEGPSAYSLKPTLAFSSV